jgi:hypothetical protein
VAGAEAGGGGTGDGRLTDLRGQYSDAVLNELESQNDGQVEGIMGKVMQLKSVRTAPAKPYVDDSFNCRVADTSVL